MIAEVKITIKTVYVVRQDLISPDEFIPLQRKYAEMSAEELAKDDRVYVSEKSRTFEARK